jgi:hypothetical protein
MSACWQLGVLFFFGYSAAKLYDGQWGGLASLLTSLPVRQTGFGFFGGGFFSDLAMCLAAKGWNNSIGFRTNIMLSIFVN